VSDTAVAPPDAPARPTPAPRSRNWLKIVATALLIVFLLALPILTGTQVGYLKVAQYILIGTVGGIGLTLLVGQAGQLSLAHPFFLLVGAVSYAVIAGDPDEAPGWACPRWSP
jgi:branched-chain amino acid transport system permease protein